MTSTDSTDDEDDHLPSTNYVRRVLREDGPMTAAELIDETGYSETTVHRALSQLSSSGLVEGRRNYPDTRKRVYELTE